MASLHETGRGGANLHLQDFLPVAHIRPGLLVRAVIGTPRLWLLDCYRDLTLWSCAGLTLCSRFECFESWFIVSWLCSCSDIASVWLCLLCL
jgi:hypothetical protein